MKALDHPDTCNPDCAWLVKYSRPVGDNDEVYGACAVSVIAQSANNEFGVPIVRCSECTS